MKREVRYFAQDGEEYFLSDCSKYFLKSAHIHNTSAWWGILHNNTYIWFKSFRGISATEIKFLPSNERRLRNLIHHQQSKFHHHVSTTRISIFDQVTLILILKYHSQSDTDWAELVRLVLDNENLDKLKVGSDIFKVAEVVARPLPGAWEHD